MDFRSRKLSIISFLFALPFLFPVVLKSQDAINTKPKVAYVLSGGGARGLAHIGVLKILEEAGLHPDIITGTSMGSIIGGLYAIGYTADDLSKINANMDWSLILSDNVSLRNVAIDEKFEYHNYFFELPIRNKKISLPTGLIEGQNLSIMISELTWRTAGVNNFDDFVVPFRCVGTEIIRGDVVVFDTGDLATAMRASMAIPSIFSPVVPDSDHVIVDGGVIRNFPVEEAKALGADIIIGIYVGFEEDVTSHDLSSLSTILTRSTAAYGISDSRNQSKFVDILIVPDLKKYTAADFVKGVEIEKAGEEAALAHYDELKKLADSINTFSNSMEVESFEKKDSILIKDIEIIGLDNIDSNFVLDKMEIARGNYISKDQMHVAIQRLFGILSFEKLTYRFEALGDGYKLILEAKEKPPSALKLAIHYDNYYGAGIKLNYTGHNLLLKNTKLVASIDINKYLQSKLSYQKYFGRHKNMLLSLGAGYSYNLLPVFVNEIKAGMLTNNLFNVDLLLKHSFNLNSQIGAGAVLEYSDVNPAESVQILYPDQFSYKYMGYWGAGVVGYFINYTFDNVYFPRLGRNLSLDCKAIFNPQLIIHYLSDSLNTISNPTSFVKLKLDYDRYIPLNHNISLNVGGTIGLSTGELNYSNSFYAGGYKYNLRSDYVSFTGFNIGDISTNNLVKFKMGLNYRPFTNFEISFISNVIAVANSYSDFKDYATKFDKSNFVLAGGIGLTYKTPLGPVSIIIADNDKNSNTYWYVNLGFPF